MVATPSVTQPRLSTAICLKMKPQSGSLGLLYRLTMYSVRRSLMKPTSASLPPISSARTTKLCLLGFKRHLQSWRMHGWCVATLAILPSSASQTSLWIRLCRHLSSSVLCWPLLETYHLNSLQLPTLHAALAQMVRKQSMHLQLMRACLDVFEVSSSLQFVFLIE
jgi:hypothetical protein